MNRFDVPSEALDPAQPYVAAFHAWESSFHERYRLDNDLAKSYLELLTRFREKCAESEREKRNAMIWEKEQRMAERELNGLKAAAVSSKPLASHPTFSVCRCLRVFAGQELCLALTSDELTTLSLGIIALRLCCYRRRWSRLP